MSLEKKKSAGEIVRYGIAGVTTTLVNLGIYRGLLLLGLDYKISNVVAILGSKIYGYLINKLFVFRSHCDSNKTLLKEVARYVLTRGFTGVVDYVGLLFAVEIAGFDKVFSKYIIQIIVIALNFFLGKLIVFKGTNDDGASKDGIQLGELRKVYDKEPSEESNG